MDKASNAAQSAKESLQEVHFLFLFYYIPFFFFSYSIKYFVVKQLCIYDNSGTGWTAAEAEGTGCD